MKKQMTGKLIWIERYIDTSFGDCSKSMSVAVERTTFFGRKIIDKDNLFGFSNDDLKVGDEVCYNFNGYSSSKYIIKRSNGNS